MKKITIASLVFISLIGVLIAATPKKQIPPNLETALINLNSAIDLAETDTASARPLIEAAAEYLKSNWTDAQILSFIDARWPTPQTIYYNCIYHCTYDIYNECVSWTAVGGGPGDEVATVDIWCVQQHIADCKRRKCGV